MKNKKVFKSIVLAAIVTPLVFGTVGLSAGIITAVRALTVNGDSYFTYTDGSGNVFKCYSITGEDTKVAIAWGMETAGTSGGLSLPSTISHEEETYTVAAIAKAGFRYCGFSTISVPNTVEDIGEEAFAYCENLTSFTLPYPVTEIKPSTFLDCRNMRTFLYYNESGSVVVANNSVTTIGDHAFDTCISLAAFECPNTLVSIGQSAFQRCRALTRIFLPSKKVVNSQITNYISIGSYAFADCENLAWVYFEENLQTVDDYAFVNCNEEFMFHYAYDGATRPDPSYSTHWRKVYLDTGKSNVWPIDSTTHVVIYQTDDYPGLRYTIQNSTIYLDCQSTTPKTIVLDNSGTDYAVIYQWTPPTTTIPGYYDISTGALTIPGSLTYGGNSYPLKIIQAETFRGRTEITSVKFANGIVQICFRAFYGCTNISSLDFSECTTLKEIGNCLFSDIASNNVKMELVSSLTIPNTVEYIGKYAFYNFVNLSSLSFKTDEDAPSNIKVLGGYAFGNCGKNHHTALFDVELPCSLNDNVAKEAMINKKSTDDPRMKNDTSTDDYNTVNWAAVGPYAFGGRDGNTMGSSDGTAVRVVSMDEPTASQLADKTYTCSFAANAFNRSWYMTKFVASQNMCLIGCDAFKNCLSLKEVFLTTAKATAYVTRTGYKYPWGAKKDDKVTEAGKNPEHSCFTSGGSPIKDLVIYCDGSAPGDIDDLNIDKNVNTWNCDIIATNNVTQAYLNDLSLGSNQESSSRFSFPTYYNVNFDDVVYWRPQLNANTPGAFLTGDDVPDDISDYDAGVISFVKEGTKYSLTRYYCDNSQINNTYRQEIDLTGVSDNSLNVSSNLTKIGSSAFGTNDTTSVPGLYYILPESIVEIGERAFYRKAGTGDTEVSSRGVRIVTYKSGNNIAAPSGTTYANSKGSHGYCMLPNATSIIYLDAFYNNYFESVQLGSGLTHLGANAFYTHSKQLKNNNNRSALASFTMTANSNFTATNNGIYYIGDVNKKTLIYQAQSDATSSLIIDSGTKAIGFGAVANTSYTSITLNNELTHIYGAGFAYNLKLATVTVNSGSQLKYISAVASDDEIWSSTLQNDTSLPTSIVDFRSYSSALSRRTRSRTSAFRGCTALTTLNFKNLTNLIKIGSAAFKDCSNLENCGVSSAHAYYTYSGGTSVSLKESISAGVLDLTSCTNLRVIHKGAFRGCNKIKYIELPETSGDLYLGVNKEGLSVDQAYTTDSKYCNDNVITLFKDTAQNACYHSTNPSSKAKAHIASGVLSGISNTYYYMSSSADIVGTGGNNNDVNYWTFNNGRYVLISGPTNAAAYWTNLNNLVFPS